MVKEKRKDMDGKVPPQNNSFSPNYRAFLIPIIIWIICGSHDHF
jgi:hypothetical protein